jgi:hypothetical protein
MEPHHLPYASPTYSHRRPPPPTGVRRVLKSKWVIVLLTLSGLSFLWILLAARAWPTAVYDTNFQTFDRSLTPPERQGVIEGTRQLMLLIAVPPVLLCACWAVTAVVLMTREASATDGQPPP